MKAMPSYEHDVLTEWLKDNPHLASAMLRDTFGLDIPDAVVRPVDTVFNTRSSDDLRADFAGYQGQSLHAPARLLLGEVQLDTKKDPEQLARYMCAGYLEYQCTVHIMVLCPTKEIAEFYARPIVTKLPGYTPTAYAFGPHNIPAMTDQSLADTRFSLACLSVMFHGTDRKVGQVWVNALKHVPEEEQGRYIESTVAMAVMLSGPESKNLLEELMHAAPWIVTPYADSRHEAGKAEGKREAKIESIMTLLNLRGIAIPLNVRDLITATTDEQLLEVWFERATNADSIDDLFTE